MSDLLPKLKPVRVNPNKLYLDPNNPRFITHEEDRIDEKRFLDADVIDRTRKKMRGKKDEYNIEIIINSITTNGWQPVDIIFVRRFDDDADRFVVLEGNRRVVAIKELLESQETAAELREQLESIEVMEIHDKIDKRRPVKSEAELRKKISYLLGVRHHGSLKTWSPFAQAANIYEKYLSRSDQTDATFQWKEEVAKDIAQTLSMKHKDVKERIQVFRAMKQIGETPIVKVSEKGEGDDKGGIKDRYYSVCREVLKERNSPLRKYIAQDSSDFLLDGESLERIISLCHFHKRARKDSPINNPQQWRFLGKILDDDVDEKRISNLERVEVGKEKPEDVWAVREAELQRPEWGRWLSEVARVFQGLTIAHLEVNEESTAVMTRLTNILAELGDQ
jgi:hypothetical protein